MRLDCYIVSSVYHNQDEEIVCFRSTEREEALTYAAEKSTKEFEPQNVAYRSAWPYRVTVYHIQEGVIIENYGSTSR